jgi:hypothetical protein
VGRREPQEAATTVLRGAEDRQITGLLQGLEGIQQVAAGEVRGVGADNDDLTISQTEGPGEGILHPRTQIWARLGVEGGPDPQGGEVVPATGLVVVEKQEIGVWQRIATIQHVQDHATVELRRLTGKQRRGHAGLDLSGYRFPGEDEEGFAGHGNEEDLVKWQNPVYRRRSLTMAESWRNVRS